MRAVTAVSGVWLGPAWVTYLTWRGEGTSYFGGDRGITCLGERRRVSRACDAAGWYLWLSLVPITHAICPGGDRAWSVFFFRVALAVLPDS